LLTVLFRNPNFLILDEPTNDLDLPTLSVLENFLIDFPGCVVIVSHDRYFMDKLVDHLFVFEGNGAIKDFPGNYTQYRLEEKVSDSLQTKEERKKDSVANRESQKDQDRSSNVGRKLSYKEKREFEQLEKEIPELEAERKNLTEKLSSNISYEEITSVIERLLLINTMLDEKEMRWLELSEFVS
jgi:ATP-binding cassette subfamily F protein uup